MAATPSRETKASVTQRFPHKSAVVPPGYIPTQVPQRGEGRRIQHSQLRIYVSRRDEGLIHTHKPELMYFPWDMRSNEKQTSNVR